MSVSSHHVFTHLIPYTGHVPKLWSDTIETHRREVHEAILDITAALVAERGLRAVTMSEIAEKAGIGRATLYKYFPDVEVILLAWHERHVTGHLAHLVALRDGARDPGARLEAVLEGYALIARERSHEHQGTDLVALVHQGEHVARAEHQLSVFLRDLLVDGAKIGVVRDDVAPDELVGYCLSALSAAGSLRSRAAVLRLVTVTLAGLRPAHRSP